MGSAAILFIFLCILLLGFLWLQQSLSRDGFDDAMKPMYLVWRGLKEEGLHKNGFGDKLRGALAMHQYCSAHNIPLIVDATEDVCGKFLKFVRSKSFEDSIQDQPVHQISQFLNLEEELNALALPNHVITNHFPNTPLSEEDKTFGKFICTPTPELQLLIDQTKSYLPVDYSIQHFRFNDDVFKKDVESSDPLFQKYIELLQSSYQPNDVLLSNSNNFKKQAKELLGIATIPCWDDTDFCELGHIGLSNNETAVKQSFLEFFVIAGATSIQTYTCYSWESNFVMWTRIIHNIPSENHIVEV